MDFNHVVPLVQTQLEIDEAVVVVGRTIERIVIHFIIKARIGVFQRKNLVACLAFCVPLDCRRSCLGNTRRAQIRHVQVPKYQECREAVIAPITYSHQGGAQVTLNQRRKL